MQVPKNVVQVGTVSGERKWYIEDYVHTFIRQQKKTQATFHLYGKAEGQYRYVYGAVLEETDWKKYAREHFFAQKEIGKLRIRGDEWQIQGDGGLVILQGYFIFYEKNEAMQSYMIACKAMEEGEKEPEKEPAMEKIAAKRFREKDKIQEEETAEADGEQSGYIQQSKTDGKSWHRRLDRRGVQNEGRGTGKPSGKYPLPKVVVAAALVVLCAAGISGINRFQSVKDAGEVFGNAYRAVVEKEEPVFLIEEREIAETEEAGAQEEGQIPEMEEAEQTEMAETASPAEDAKAGETVSTVKETEAVPVENEAVTEPVPGAENENTVSEAGDGHAENADEAVNGNADAEDAVLQSADSQSESSTSANPSAEYYVEKGDSLAKISRKFYGTSSRVKDICQLNDIKNPDKIEQGQKLLLP